MIALGTKVVIKVIANDCFLSKISHKSIPTHPQNEQIHIVKLAHIFTFVTEKSNAFVGHNLSRIVPFGFKNTSYSGPISDFSSKETCVSQFFCQNFEPLFTMYHATEKKKPSPDSVEMTGTNKSYSHGHSIYLQRT